MNGSALVLQASTKDAASKAERWYWRRMDSGGGVATITLIFMQTPEISFKKSLGTLEVSVSIQTYQRHHMDHASRVHVFGQCMPAVLYHQQHLSVAVIE